MSNPEIIECFHTNSSCYKSKGAPGKYPAKPVGILVHATGDGTTVLKRYVQPSKDDPNYDALIQRIGKNRYGNSWNRDVKKSVHYMIGKDAYGVISIAQMLPLTISCWGCGSGKKGSYNYNPTAYVQFELQDGNTAEAIFKDVWQNAVALCVMLCKQYGWTEQNITSHYEAHAAGYASNHSDPRGFFSKHGLTMDDFRAAVKAGLGGEPEPEPKPIQVGDLVDFTGDTHYTSANAKKGKPCKPGEAKVKRIYRLGKSRHPYKIKGVKPCTANGWVDEADLEPLTED